MTRTELENLLAYNRWANTVTFDAAAQLTEEQRRQPIVSSFSSLTATLAHMVGAEWIWLRRWMGDASSGAPEWMAGADLAALRAKLDEVEREREAFLAPLSEAELARDIEYRTLGGVAGRTRLDDLIRHVVNHATYHRGQVTTMLRQLGGTPTSTDYVYFLRTRR